MNGQTDTWTVPLNYSSVHQVLKELRVAPYDNYKITPAEIFREFGFYIFLLILILALLFMRLLHVKKMNTLLANQSSILDKKVQSLAISVLIIPPVPKSLNSPKLLDSSILNMLSCILNS